MVRAATAITLADYVEVHIGPNGRIILSDDANAEYQKLLGGTDQLSRQQRTQLSRFFIEFCRSHNHSLTREQFRKEGDFKDGLPGGRSVGIYAFKPFKWRLYGAILTLRETRTFVGVVVDPAKKQDRAVKSNLERAAKIVGSSREYSSSR